jgi:hypothetical protein
MWHHKRQAIALSLTMNLAISLIIESCNRPTLIMPHTCCGFYFIMKGGACFTNCVVEYKPPLGPNKPGRVNQFIGCPPAAHKHPIGR